MKRKPTIIDQLRRALQLEIDGGTTQSEIEEKTGIKQYHLSRFLSGERGVSMENAAKLCQLLHLELIRRK